MIIIAGPCQLESLEHATIIATHMKELCDKHGFDLYLNNHLIKQIELV